jgi:hypothetical protein
MDSPRKCQGRRAWSSKPEGGLALGSLLPCYPLSALRSKLPVHRSQLSAPHKLRACCGTGLHLTKVRLELLRSRHRPAAVRSGEGRTPDLTTAATRLIGRERTQNPFGHLSSRPVNLCSSQGDSHTGKGSYTKARRHKKFRLLGNFAQKSPTTASDLGIRCTHPGPHTGKGLTRGHEDTKGYLFFRSF